MSIDIAICHECTAEVLVGMMGEHRADMKHDECKCDHDRSDHSRWPPIPGAEDWACDICECVEFRARG